MTLKGKVVWWDSIGFKVMVVLILGLFLEAALIYFFIFKDLSKAIESSANFF